MKKGFLLVLVIALGLQGLYAGGSKQGGTASSAKTVTIGCNVNTPYGTLDPVHEDGTILWIIELAFEGLVDTVETAGGGVALAPALADSWEISADGLFYTFHLKPGVKFADGTPVTTADWIWSFERARDTPESPWASYAEPIKAITAPNANTLVIELKRLNAPFLSMLAVHNFSVQSKARFDKLGADEYFKHPLGTGPFYFTDWGLHEYYRLEKNPYYYGGVSKVDVLQFNVVEDDNTRIMQLQAGDIDVCLNPPANRIAELQADKNIDVEIVNSTEQRYVNFNTTKPNLNNATVRRALRMATNKNEIIKMAVFGYGEPTYIVYPRIIGEFFNTDIVDEGYDPVKAKALLTQAGFPNGFTTEISYSNGNSVVEGIATLLKAQWAQIGVTLNLTPMEGAALSEQFDTLNHTITMLRWSEDTNDPAGLTDFIAVYDQSHGFHTGFKNSRMTELAEIAAGTVDTAKRAAAYKEIQKILYDEAPLFPVYQASYFLATRKNISGFKQLSLGQYDLSELVKN
ncbi:putative ABC transporter component [Treponema primitia ZAS-2]|uniref:Putative ABC transporter component n=1 Tax=Treponema primitia (strain ATCC BAA-887 / DSM 12427 / ZAS-2) TaxID=545694 RepID=F5YHE9_TREPZ|nr:ABC transporter substrate-binding protein [Treponema primitia]AEF84911.1 putative ABC transporter component [Treponema primitia ZAS-2]